MSFATWTDDQEEREKIESAYAEMKKRGWGFARNKATGKVAVGPWVDNKYLDVIAFGEDGPDAVCKAIAKVQAQKGGD